MKYSVCICNCFYENNDLLNELSDVQITRVFKNFNSIEQAFNFLESIASVLSKNDYWIVSEDDRENILDLEQVYYHEDGIDVLDEPKMYRELFKIYQDKYLG